jgi:hypothetical protein
MTIGFLRRPTSIDYQHGNWLVMLCRPQYWQLRDYSVLSLNARYRPSHTVPSGTQRARLQWLFRRQSNTRLRRYSIYSLVAVRPEPTSVLCDRERYHPGSHSGWRRSRAAAEQVTISSSVQAQIRFHLRMPGRPGQTQRGLLHSLRICIGSDCRLLVSLSEGRLLVFLARYMAPTRDSWHACLSGSPRNEIPWQTRNLYSFG